MFKRKKGDGEPEEEQQLQQQQSAESDAGGEASGDSLPRTAAFGPAIGEGVDLPHADQSNGDSPPHHPPPPPPLPGNENQQGKFKLKSFEAPCLVIKIKN